MVSTVEGVGSGLNSSTGEYGASEGSPAAVVVSTVEEVGSGLGCSTGENGAGEGSSAAATVVDCASGVDSANTAGVTEEEDST